MTPISGHFRKSEFAEIPSTSVAYRDSISRDALAMRQETPMFHTDNIHPLTDFKRNTAEFRERLKKSGMPTILTVEGRAELVVQDANAYQKLIDALEHVEAVEGIRQGLDSMKHGKGMPAKEFFENLRRSLKTPLPPLSPRSPRSPRSTGSSRPTRSTRSSKGKR